MSETRAGSAFEVATGLSGESAERALRALQAAGFVIMPIRPTKTILEAGETAIRDCEDSTRDTNGTYSWVDYPRAAFKSYRAMLASVWPAIDLHRTESAG